MIRTIARTLSFAAVTALALSVAPAAKAENKGCSSVTLKGTFARRDNGVILAPPAIAGPIAGVATMTFDGNGGITSSGMGNVNGNVSSSTSTGTYTVNPDCTGTYTTTSDTGRTGSAFFVISDSGNQLDILVLGSTSVITCVARRQFPVGDWRQ